ncbi:MAG: hypothetical protein KDK45_16955, partial [Leptospiraceae bacterium]|nr:hypothetical protein [Leptospiraceae bacterium]
MKTNQIGNRNFSIRIFSESGESIQDIFREGYVKAKVTERLSSTLFRIVLNGRTLHAKSGLQLHPGELLSLKLEKGQTGLIFRLLERSFSKHHLEEEKFIQKLKGFTERPISNLLKEAKMSTLHKSEDLKVFQILNTLFPFLEWK